MGKFMRSVTHFVCYNACAGTNTQFGKFDQGPPTMREFAAFSEQGEHNWGAIVPDLPGCVSIGDTLVQVQENVREAIELYLGALREWGEPVPESRHRIGNVIVAA